MNINEYVLSFNRSDYQRDNFDNFLHHIKFHYDVPTIHIAGTNGKGSTATYIYEIYKKAGYKVGLFTSPFFYSFHEMIKVNDVEINDEEIENILNPYKKQLEKNDLSSFEVQTFIALEFFKLQKVDIAIVECGMGGEEDATNIFASILSVITSISLEHTNFLGKSLSEIAEQKGGIIKPQVPVLIGELPEEATSTISKICKENKSLLKITHKYAFETLKNDGYYFDYLPYEKLHIRSSGEYSILDACLAIDAVGMLTEKYPVSEANVRDGLLSTVMPFRLEFLMDHPTLVIDGAHNPEAMENLSKSIAKIANNREIHVIFACFRDKNYAKMLDTLAVMSNDVSLTTFDHPRARTEEEYFLYLSDYPFSADYVSLINQKIKEYPNDLILITGSLAFVSFVKRDFLDKKIKYEEASI